uniref:Uncharacterized protein n=1 Tax=Oryza sativa subsp. japonica TaxID=39947 RepID=Q652F7_ORYSJ|nr:hypothetical protein [Oryza sativa Japonica Group]
MPPTTWDAGKICADSAAGDARRRRKEDGGWGATKQGEEAAAGEGATQIRVNSVRFAREAGPPGRGEECRR